MSSNDKAISPAELSQLEQAFFAQPTLESCAKLTEAYLAAGRHMEAMVVCKKAVKSYGTSPGPHVLLARVYQAQQKDKKALEELKAALALAPGDLEANRMSAELLYAANDAAGGKTHLEAALRADPADRRSRELAQKHAVELPAAHRAAPAPVVAPAPVAAPAPVPAPVVAPVLASAAVTAPRPVYRPPPVDLSAYAEPPPQAQKSGGRVTVILAVAGVLALGGWYVVTSRAKDRLREVDRLMKSARTEMLRDTFAGYKAAATHCERTLDLDDSKASARSALAYIDAVLAAEHGDNEASKNAAESLSRAKAQGEVSQHLVCAEAYIKAYGGEARDARTILEEAMEAQGGTPLFHQTRGAILLYSGDLEQARGSLEAAQKIDGGNVRTLALLGKVHRMRGTDIAAWNFFDSAIRYEPGHVDAMLGKALLVLDSEHGDLTVAQKLVEAVFAMPQKDVSPRQVAQAHLVRAQLAYEKGDKVQGANDEKAAQSMDPNNPEIQIFAGRRLLKEGLIDEAVGKFKKAIELDKKRAAFYVDLARALMSKSGGPRLAIEHLTRAQAQLPDSGKILVLLGDAYAASDMGDKARASYEKAMEVERGYPDARLALGALWRKKRDFGRAQSELEAAVAEFAESSVAPDRVSAAYVELGKVFEDKGDTKSATESFSKALKADASYPTTYFELGRFLSTRDQKQAKELLERYVVLAPRGQYSSEAGKLLATLK